MRGEDVAAVVFGVDGLQSLLDELAAAGFTVYAPVVRDGALVPAPVESLDELPRGVVDEQSPGRYRLTHDGGGAFFGHAAAATSWKPLLFPARRTLWRFADDVPVADEPDRTRRAFLGVRSCDLHAIAVQDRVLAQRPLTDGDYVTRRAGTFIVAVTCGHPAQTCFCVSMGTGPRPDAGFDIALTELLDDAGHRFLAEAGTAAGSDVLDRISTGSATSDDHAEADAVVRRAVERIEQAGRAVDTEGVRDLLYANAEHPRWAQVADRCLACTNCTLVCPTCFCVTTEDVVALTEPIGRDRVWDSCFNPEHSQLHGGPVHRGTRTRYRQWLTHKFASWIDQFGTSGCVGCGRCITWCPAGIDVTEELAAIRADPARDEERS